MNEVKIYLDVNTILDTNLELVSSISSIVKEDLDKYRMRSDNNFIGLISKNTLESRKKDFHKFVSLRNCRMTPFLFVYKKLIASYEELNVSSVNPVTVSIQVNMYPLRESESDIKVLLNALKVFYGVSNISYMNLAPEQLDIEAVKKYSHMSMYDLDYWLNLHINELLTKPQDTMEITSPLIKKDELKDITVEEAVEKVETFLQPYFKLRLLPLSVFSIDKKKT